jgi:hypothetical protein
MTSSKLINVHSIVAELIFRTGDESIDKMKPQIARWIKDCLLQIDSKKQVKRKYIYIPLECCNKVTLPVEWSNILCVLLGDQTDRLNACQTPLFDGMIQNATISINSGGLNPITNDYVYIWSTGDNIIVQPLHWEIQYDDIVFPYNTIQEEGITVIYEGLETDEEGLPLVFENHKKACVEYVLYYLLGREQFRMLRTQKDIKNGLRFVRKEQKDNYINAIRMARADDAKSTPTQEHELASMYNNPLSGYSYIKSQI